MAGSLYRVSLAGMGLLGAAIVAAANPPNLNELLQNSPFGRASAAPTAKSSTPLEFRGVMVEDGVYYFSIYEAADSRSTWVQLNEKTNNDFVAKRFDEPNNQLTVEYQGGSLTLPLTAAAGLRNPAAPSIPPPIAGPAAPPGPAMQLPTPAAEAERLRKIAEEIKRRRALRQQAITRPIPGLAK